MATLAESLGIKPKVEGEITWTKEEGEKWEKQFQERLEKVKCNKCGSSKVTASMRGKPYMVYVEWHEAKSKEVGWKTLSLSGCTKSGKSLCCDCVEEVDG